MSPQDSSTDNNDTTNLTPANNVRISESFQTRNEGVNPFTTSNMESGQFDVRNENGGYNRFGFSAFHSYKITRRYDILAKVKEAATRHCNEYRVAIFFLVLIIVIGFSVLVRMNKNILSSQDQDSLDPAVISRKSVYRHILNPRQIHHINNTGQLPLTIIFLIITGKSSSLKKICNGVDNCCSEETKCGEMEGDCNSDKDCKEGLKCGQNNCNANAGTWKPTDDCCYKPKSKSRVPNLFLLCIFCYKLHQKSLIRLSSPFFILDIEFATSSVFENDTQRWGPDFVIDGVISYGVKNFFHSELEDYPWLQWHLPRQVQMTGITLTTRYDCCGSRLRDVEVRAGKLSTTNGYKGQLSLNSLCGRFPGPGETGREYTITCDHPITADYVTIQILDDRAILALNEIRIQTVYHGKTYICDLHM